MPRGAASLSASPSLPAIETSLRNAGMRGRAARTPTHRIHVDARHLTSGDPPGYPPAGSEEACRPSGQPARIAEPGRRNPAGRPLIMNPDRSPTRHDGPSRASAVLPPTKSLGPPRRWRPPASLAAWSNASRPPLRCEAQTSGVTGISLFPAVVPGAGRRGRSPATPARRVRRASGGAHAGAGAHGPQTRLRWIHPRPCSACLTWSHAPFSETTRIVSPQSATQSTS
jgi:hypothetical protein